MGDPTNIPNSMGGQGDRNALILSFQDTNALANLPPEVEIATMRQMMQSLFARMEEMQHHQAVQLAGVHDRLDAVELEIPLIQEQSALRMHDLEVRLNSGIEEAANALQTEVAGKFSTLAAQMEAQRDELSELRELRRISEDRLNRAILDVERLCGNLSQPAAPAPRPVQEGSGNVRSRVSEHIRKAAIDLAPADDNPLISDAAARRPRPEPLVPISSAIPLKTKAEPVNSVPAPNTVPAFEAWKRQFMQNGEPEFPSLTHESAPQKTVICPKCYSDRTRPATLGRLDRVFQLAGFTPHRCKSCAHRFYKREVAASKSAGGGQVSPRTPDAMETQ